MADKQEDDHTFDMRIKALQEERVDTQKKVYTKWVNSFLSKKNMEVSDLFNDLASGVQLLILLEIISGERIGKPNDGRQKFHHIDNINRCLNFLRKKKVPLIGVSAEEIADRSARSILAIIGRIILNHKKLTDSSDSIDDDDDEKSYKEDLLQWCKNTTVNYSGVNLKDFTKSWRNGLAFNALIHKHRPDLINYDALDPINSSENLRNAFEIAEKNLAIPKLLDVEDVDRDKPDENSIVTYLALIYQTFYNDNSSKKMETKKTVIYRTEKVITIGPPTIPKSKGPATMPKPSSRFGTDKIDSYQPNRDTMFEHANTVVLTSGCWECNTCTFKNTPSTSICGMCFKVRAEDGPKPVTGGNLLLETENKLSETNILDETDILTTEMESSPAADSDSESSSLETVIENDQESSEPVEKSKENSVTLREPIDLDLWKKDPLREPPSGPSWSCPGCQHQNPETTKICSFCFRTLRQLKSLSFEEMGISKLKGNSIHSEDVQQEQDTGGKNGDQ